MFITIIILGYKKQGKRESEEKQKLNSCASWPIWLKLTSTSFNCCRHQFNYHRIWVSNRIVNIGIIYSPQEPHYKRRSHWFEDQWSKGEHLACFDFPGVRRICALMYGDNGILAVEKHSLEHIVPRFFSQLRGRENVKQASWIPWTCI